MAAQNALELIQIGRLSEPYSASYDVMHRDGRYTLRRYKGTLAAGRKVTSPVLLVPPLMLTAEIYDISSELSAAATLVREGVDVWVSDFRAPEREEGGLARTLDDHVQAVDDAIARIRDLTRRDVHLAGYSQGGMFAYQCAAYRQSEGIASVITFGSPVDIHRTVDRFSDNFAEKLTSVMRQLLDSPINRLEGVPGFLSSTGFKLLGLRKEVGQVTDFLLKLHDRQALEKREARRLFLRGDGFVAWPGPAFRTFVDEFIVNNRMATGGFVICGRTVSLADITCPILSFYGERDEMATPPAVRAIASAAPKATVHELALRAGHFGLVVGTESMTRTWPTVWEWIRYCDGDAPLPRELLAQERDRTNKPVRDEEAFESMNDEELDFDLAFDVVSSFARSAWDRVEEVAEHLGESVEHMRFQVPLLRKLRTINDSTRVSFSLALAERAESTPEQTFFLWKGRAFSYRDSHGRVDNIVKGLIACGVLPTQRIAVVMSSRPSTLSLIGALNRIGAVAVLMSPSATPGFVDEACADSDSAMVICDPETVALVRKGFQNTILVLGGYAHDERDFGADVIDLEAIDPDAVKVPSWYEANPGRASDLALIIASADRVGGVRLQDVSNHRWAFSAYGAAASATLTPKDTVYCCLPLHHAAGTLVSVGAALVGGARLALSQGFDPIGFWDETRHYGVTVVFYAGEMCRTLVKSPPSRREQRHSIRLLAGSGMRKDVWQACLERFGAGVSILEFYAATETNAVLANVAASKVGSVGSPIPGSNQVALLRFDLPEGHIVRDSSGRGVSCDVDEPGLLVTAIDAKQAYRLRPTRVFHDIFEEGDLWYSTGNLLRRDAEGDYWFVERLIDVVKGPEGPRFCLPVEAALYSIDGVELAAAYGIDGHFIAAVSGADCRISAEALSDALAELSWGKRPERVFQLESIPLSDGLRPLKRSLRALGREPATAWQAFALEEGGYRLVSSRE